MKHIFCVLAVVAFVANNALAFDSRPIPADPSMKQCLDGQWAFLFVPGNDWSAYDGFYEVGYDASGWDSISVPGCWDALGYLPPRYAHPDDVNGLYRTSFTVPRDWKDKRVFINLDGVLRAYELWVNGHLVGSWELANNSRQFELTDYVEIGCNVLSMRVYTRYKGYEFDGNDDWGQVGIHRDVTLFAVPNTHVKDISIVSKVPEQDPVEVSFSITLSTAKGVVKGKIRNPSGRVEESFSVRADKGIACYTWKPSAPQLWTAETPSLYTLSYDVWQGGKSVETLSRKFGIREIRIDGAKLLLNNKLFKLRGVNTHATDPFRGKVVSEELNLKDMRMMKEGNVNFIRNSHYPREPRFYDLCDSLGFYVMDEVPFGYGDEHLTDTSYQDNLLLRADATVARDRNHPCVIIWSVGNENNLTEICKVTGQHVQELDPSRPICYPMIGSYFYRHHFDWPGFIDIFSPHYPTLKTLKEYAEKSFKPLILTEYCHTLGQSFEQHHERWEVMQANDNLAGGAVWEWVDQGMPGPDAEWPGKYAWTDKVWLSQSVAIQMEGNKGTDGLLYATRDPLPNYFGMRKNYAQAYVLTEKVSVPSTGIVAVEIENRYDFLDLKDKVSCRWQIYCPSGGMGLGERNLLGEGELLGERNVLAEKDVLAEGDVTPSCLPHQRCTVSIDASSVLDKLPGRLCLLTLQFEDKSNGLQVNEKTFVLNSEEQYAEILHRLGEGLSGVSGKTCGFGEELRGVDGETGCVDGETGCVDGQLHGVDTTPLWRTGRKPFLAEEVYSSKPGGRYVKHYIVRVGDLGLDDGCYFAGGGRIAGRDRFANSGRFVDSCGFANSEITYNGKIKIEPVLCGEKNLSGSNTCGLKYTFDMHPEGENLLLTEAGLALLLDSTLCCFQWVGNGPYAAYPGKDNANFVGVHAMRAGDLYFEGNRMGVDALLCTDTLGNGVLFLPETHQVNFEQTDKGILVSFNPIVSGIGSKGHLTEYAHHVDDTPSVSGSFTALPVKAGQWTEALKQMFRNPSTIGKYAPFESVYETCLMKLSDILK